MEEFQALIPPRPRWLLQLAIEVAGIAPVRRLICAASLVSIRNNLDNQTATLEMPFWLFMGPLAAGSALLVVETAAMLAHTWRAARPEAEADRPDIGAGWSGFIVVLAFLALFVLGFPVVLAIGIPCVVYMLANDLPLELIAQRTLYALDSFPLVAVPVFLFVGSLMNSAGISRYIYAFADTACGRLPGGLAQVNIFGSLIFAGMSGSALADIGGIGRIEIDAMRQKGFNAAVRRRRDLGLGDRRADLPADRSRSSSTAPSPASR